jgi:hypothetical protein
MSEVHRLNAALNFLTSHILDVSEIADNLERAQEAPNLVLGLNHSEAPEKDLLDGHSAKTIND